MSDPRATRFESNNPITLDIWISMSRCIIYIAVFSYVDELYQFHVRAAFRASNLYNLKNENLKSETTSSAQSYVFPGVQDASYSTIVSCESAYKYNSLAKRALVQVGHDHTGPGSVLQNIQAQLELCHCESNLCASCHTNCESFAYDQKLRKWVTCSDWSHTSCDRVWVAWHWIAFSSPECGQIAYNYVFYNS